jgi:hypothetical protein
MIGAPSPSYSGMGPYAKTKIEAQAWTDLRLTQKSLRGLTQKSRSCGPEPAESLPQANNDHLG